VVTLISFSFFLAFYLLLIFLPACLFAVAHMRVRDCVAITVLLRFKWRAHGRNWCKSILLEKGKLNQTNFIWLY